MSIFVPLLSLYPPAVASTKEFSLLISMACRKASSKVLMYEFLFAIFVKSLSLVNCGSFLAYSMMTVLLSCSLGDRPNGTQWIDSHLELKVTNGSLALICKLCNLAEASVVLGMLEKLARIASFTSLSEANVESPQSMCNIDGAMLWHINSHSDELLNFAAASTWLSHVIHSTLLVPSKILIFIICLLSSSFLLFVT